MVSGNCRDRVELRKGDSQRIARAALSSEDAHVSAVQRSHECWPTGSKRATDPFQNPGEGNCIVEMQHIEPRLKRYSYNMPSKVV
jgi:hypothetical protein